MAEAKTSLAPAIDFGKLVKDMPFKGGVRKDGIYEIPGQTSHDGMYLSCFALPSELERIKDSLEFNEQDVISSGFPKTGSTWVNELIFLICNDANVELASKVGALEKLPFLEYNFDLQPNQVDTISAMPSPRLIKSHLPARYFQRNIDKREKGPKVIITMRNPKDNLVSFYHFYKMNPGLGPFDGDWNEFFELFKKKRTMYGDCFDNNVAWWAFKDHPNVYIVKYEDLKKDVSKEIALMAKFLGRSLTDEQIGAIANATRFDNMKKGSSHKHFEAKDDPNKSFFRKGKVGGWGDHFTDEQSAYIDQLCAEKYAPIGLTFEC